MVRELILKILVNILKEGAYSNIELNKCFKVNKLDQRDTAFISEMVMGVLKYKERLDYVIAQFSSIKLKKISVWIINTLRMGVYQLMFMDRVPQSAAVNECVKLAKRYGHAYSSKFVNGVLRNIARNIEKIEYPAKDTPEYLSVCYSYPMWLVEKFVDEFGHDFAKELLKSLNDKPKFCIRANTTKVTVKELLDMFKERGVKAFESGMSKYGLVVENSHNITGMDLYENGYFTIQDESSMKVAEILDPRVGDVVIDVCAAPGGKTTHIAEIMNNSGVLYSQDLYLHKVNLIKSAAKRLGLSNIKTNVYDATNVRENLIGKADKVLVDAPCTGLGIVRRKPDIKWRKEISDIDNISTLQYKILCSASKYVKVGGSIVYSTCTVMREENIEVVNKFLKEHGDFEIEDITGFIPDSINSSTAKDGYMEFYPNIQGTDGFFVAKMKKIK
ncbi:MAG: 16S rRNA (cytosine(967)-C(5))-methyltransferase RsmB [Clostridiales bacterium]|nr:16S rRNA (cytosine(967)-C(5))-methyltransferase RsmB [Clostridiales bacterium]